MSKSTQKYAEEVYAFLLDIPAGKVVTYGQIAAYLGNPGLARVVGNILHHNPDGDNIPCYKVVNSQGELSCHFAFDGIAEQQARLEADGIVVQDGKVDLTNYQWR